MKLNLVTGLSNRLTARAATGLTWATLAVALTGLLTMPAVAQPGGPMHRGAMHGEGHQRGFGPMGGLSERMLDEVKATPEQRSQLRQIMESARKDMRAQHEATAPLRDEAARLLAQPNVDANALEALRQKQLAQHDQASRRMTQAMLDASRVLSPQQRQQWAERMQQRRQMMQRHRHERESLDKRSS